MAAFALLALGIGLIATAAVVFPQSDEKPESSINVLGYEISRDRVAIPTDWGEPLTKPLQVQVASAIATSTSASNSLPKNLASTTTTWCTRVESGRSTEARRLAAFQMGSMETV
ncbi:MAG: hypothetical protein QGH54_04285 [SAR202 cluster bacterium]|jgi:hypothetical protein|nr:hypothetical protein [SAR202 cluster bacterium]